MIYFRETSFFRACLSGLFLFIVALGINQFSYTPIIPFLVAQSWVTLPEASYIGTASFLGYFLGTLISHRSKLLFGHSNAVALALILSFLSISLCSFNFGYIWLATWRMIAGVMAGLLMVLSPSLLMSKIDDDKRELASGIIFCGIGLGITLTSLFVSPLNSLGNALGIWIGLSVFTLILCFPACLQVINTPTVVEQPPRNKNFFSIRKNRRTLIFCILGYSLYSIGLTPSMLFLSDYIHRDLGASLSESGNIFSLLGIGCILGALFSGFIYKKMGAYYSAVLVTFFGITGFLLVSFDKSLLSASLNALLTGFHLVGMAVIMSLFVGEMFGIKHHAKIWLIFTLSFSCSQFLGGYFYSHIISLKTPYIYIFRIGLMFLVLSLFSYLLSHCKEKTNTPSDNFAIK